MIPKSPKKGSRKRNRKQNDDDKIKWNGEKHYVCDARMTTQKDLVLIFHSQDVWFEDE